MIHGWQFKCKLGIQYPLLLQLFGSPFFYDIAWEVLKPSGKKELLNEDSIVKGRINLGFQEFIFSSGFIFCID